MIRDLAISPSFQDLMIIQNDGKIETVVIGYNSRRFITTTRLESRYGPFTDTLAVACLEGTYICFASFDDLRLLRFDIRRTWGYNQNPAYVEFFALNDKIERMTISDIKMDYLFGIVGNSVVALNMTNPIIPNEKYHPFSPTALPHLLTSLSSFPFVVVSEFGSNKVESLKVQENYTLVKVFGGGLEGLTRIDSIMFVSGMKLVIAAGDS